MSASSNDPRSDADQRDAETRDVTPTPKTSTSVSREPSPILQKGLAGMGDVSPTPKTGGSVLRNEVPAMDALQDGLSDPAPSTDGIP